jgi:hypothetical protein
MSSPLAGKFQDHYVILGVDPKSDTETIQQAYSKLVEKYHPNNTLTGSAEKLESINAAYECLMDPQLRSIFDNLTGVDKDGGGPKFSGVEFFDALGREALRRIAVLCVLYDRRLSKPSAPSFSMRHLESIVDATPVELASALWYLKQKGLAASDDKSSLQITVDGMDFLENKRPLPEDVMAFIKPGAIASGPIAAAPIAADQAPPKREMESVMTTLNRALARS